MKLNKAEIMKRVHNPKVWVATIALLCFVVDNAGRVGFTEFVTNGWNYVYTFGMAIGFWTSHAEKTNKGEDVQ